jgi:hypothetical protein
MNVFSDDVSGCLKDDPRLSDMNVFSDDVSGCLKDDPRLSDMNVFSDEARFDLLYYFFIILSGVRLSPLGTAAAVSLLYQTQMIDNSGCGAIGGMKIGRGN